jgi:hypothetical protein
MALGEMISDEKTLGEKSLGEKSLGEKNFGWIKAFETQFFWTHWKKTWEDLLFWTVPISATFILVAKSAKATETL